jgi:plasmid maintenance system antidote protein VapI
MTSPARRQNRKRVRPPGSVAKTTIAEWSQADIARELGVTRQAIQKMMSL